MPAPANDLCANATAISSLPYSVSANDNTSATESVGDPLFSVAGSGTLAGAAAVYKTQFWTYTPGSNQTVQLTCTQPLVMLGFFTGSCGSLTEVASWNSSLTVNLTSGTTYTIVTGSYTNTGYTFDLALDTSTDPSYQIQSTAKDVGNLASVSNQTVDLSTTNDNGSTHQVYYKYTATSAAILGVFPYKSSSTIRANVYKTPYHLYDSNSFAPTIAADTVPIQIPMDAGDTAIIRIRHISGTPGSTTTRFEKFAPQATPMGSIAIPDDADGFPMAIVSASTGEVLKFVDPFPAGEAGDIVASAQIALVEDMGAGNLKLYNAATWTQTGTVTALGSNAQYVRTNLSTGKFWFGDAGLGGTHAKVRSVTTSGSLGATTYDLGSAGLLGIATSPDEAILYYSQAVGGAIKRWDLSGNAATSDLAAGLANYKVTDILVDRTGNVYVGLFKSTVTRDFIVRKYTAAGALVTTYNFGSDLSSTNPRLAYDLGPDTYFIAWTHTATSGESVFHRVTIADGTDTTITSRVFEGGAYQGAVSATPSAYFGHSFSCPLFLVGYSLTDLSEPCCCACPPPAQTSGTPIAKGTAPGPVLPPVDSTWTPACDGGGVVPTAADLTDPESWANE